MNFNNIKMYRCACGCVVKREGTKQITKDGARILYCIKHKDGRVVSKFGICKDCGDEYDIELSKHNNPARCQECIGEKAVVNTISTKTRKWDCGSYEDCLFNSPKSIGFDCDKCDEYIHKDLIIDLSNNYESNVDDLNHTPKANPGGKN